LCLIAAPHDVELFYATEEHFGSFYRFGAFLDSLGQLKTRTEGGRRSPLGLSKLGYLMM
jgi:hypothetical protein